MATFEEQWLECQDKYGKNIEAGDMPVLGINQVDTSVSLPAVKFTAPFDPSGNNVFEQYVHVPMSTFKQKIDDLAGEVSEATSDLEDLKDETENARDDANTAATRAENAATGAENVNATMVGMTVTITDRNGVSHSENIGFEIYRTYASVAAMNADAANVPEGKFVIIATTSATDPENARLYCRNGSTAQQPFSLLSDLDQASSAAWADWLNNMKPAIQSAITTAGTDHTQAVSDHQTAATDHSTAAADHTQAGTDHSASVSATGSANAQANRAKAWADHPPFIGNGTTGEQNYWYLWNETTQAYVRNAYAKGDNLDWSTLTQTERDRLINDMLEFLETEGFDAVPTQNSTKPVRSGGIYNALLVKYEKPNGGIPKTDLAFSLGTASEKNVPASGNASSTQVVMGNDSRLSDSRPASDVSAWAKASTKPTYTKSDVGLGNVENKSSATIRSELTSANVTGALGYTPPTKDTVPTFTQVSGKSYYEMTW